MFTLNKDKRLYNKLKSQYKKYLYNRTKLEYGDSSIHELEVDSAQLALDGITTAFDTYNENMPLITENNLYRLDVPKGLSSFIFRVKGDAPVVLKGIRITTHRHSPKYLLTAQEYILKLQHAKNIDMVIINKLIDKTYEYLKNEVNKHSKMLFNKEYFLQDYILFKTNLPTVDYYIIRECILNLGAFLICQDLVRGSTSKRIIDLDINEQFAFDHKEELLYFANNHNAIIPYYKG